MKEKKFDKNKSAGITLIALVVTIIVLLILAGISVGMLNGDNGIIGHAGTAKESSEIAEEKEIIQTSTVHAMKKNRFGELTKDELKNELSNNTKREIKVYSDEEFYIIMFEKRAYKVDYDGNVDIIEDQSILIGDTTPGDITKDENGKNLEGNEADPFIIMSIEDLVALSQSTNTGTTLNGKYVKLGRNLDFKSELSYCDYETKEYNEYLGVTDNIGLMEILTDEKYNGFVPNKVFSGSFDGDGKTIKNLYIKKDEDAGFFKREQSKKITIKNLEITGKIICNGNYCGTFISIGSGTIENCISKVDITSTGDTICGIAGGVTCINCKNYGSVKGNEDVGGIGSNAQNCENYGKISGKTRVGGIIGYTTYGSITNCKNYGDITADSYAGGINGWYAKVSNCENYGKITANNGGAGGIIAYARGGNTDGCINYGIVVSNGVAGGIARMHK